MFKGFTVVQAVGRQHFVSEARDRFPASPFGGFVVNKILLGVVFVRVFSVVPLQYYPVNNFYSIHLLLKMHNLRN